jgi:hypothetical protein
MRQLYERSVAGNNNPIVAITVELSDGQRKTFRGRDAWCLAELIAGGLVGVTPIERPAPRWSHYIWKLKRAGVHIDTVYERHGGAYSGTHGRYLLRTALRIVEVVRQSDAKTKRKDGVRGFAPLPIPMSA